MFTSTMGLEPATSSITAEPTTTLDTGDLADPEIRTVVVDGTSMVVAWADEPETRARGLMEVDDLGDLDGMLFDLEEERIPTFTMRNTLVPIDIAFFDSEGNGVGFLEMVPCDSEPCPTYSIDQPARYALEVLAGSFPMGPDSMLEFPEAA